MNKSNIYHGGSARKPGYTMSGGGIPITSEFYTSLIHCNSEEIDVGVSIPAPSDGTWNDDRQGWYFGSDYILKELHLLYNTWTNLGANTITINMRRRLADGSVPAFISVYTIVTILPATGTFFGDHAAGLSITIPAGFYVYAYCTARTIFDAEGLALWAQYQKAP